MRNVLAVSVLACLACSEAATPRADLRTDASAYSYTNGSQNPLMVRATITNRGSGALTLRRCEPESGPVVHVVALSGSPRLGADSSCTGGNPPILLASGEGRTDTIMVGGPESTPPAGSQFNYQIEYVLQGEAESNTSAEFRTVRSNTFTVTFD